MKERYWYIPFLIAAILISVYIRVINPWNNVFVWTVKFGGNDPWYYYRLIENCLHNFPNRIWFDPFTNYPFGTYTHFGPFLVYFSVILIKIFGLNDPESIKSLLAFIPVIGGTLIIMSTYLFSSSVFNRKVGVISALLISMIPGQFLHRSVLGFNDHHIWEVFWLVTTLGLYVYTVKIWEREENPVKSRNAIFYSILTGISYGFLLYTWAPSFIFAPFIVSFIFIAMLFKKFLKIGDINNLIYVTVIMLSVSSILYVPFIKTPYFGTNYYSPLQLLVLLGCIGLLAVFWTINLLKERTFFKGREEHLFPATLIAVVIVSVGVLAILAPQIYYSLYSVIGVIRPKGGALTIAEVQPFFTMYGEFSLAPAWIHFSMTFIFGFFGFIYLIYKIYRERDVNHVLVFLWSLTMFIALCGQNRFAYYFAPVCAVLSALITDRILEYLKFYDFISNLKSKKVKISWSKIILSILIIVILFYPTISMANEQSKVAGGIGKEWYDALVWLRENTADGFYDEYYYELYEPSKNVSEPYHYPAKTYGVMSWWDYGHWIEAIGHRMPNANPFQQGIGAKYSRIPGASWFFTAYNESEAEYIAESLNVKYVISDVEMLTGKFFAIAVWAEGSLEKASSIYYSGPWYIYSTPSGIGIAPTIYDIPMNAKIIGTISIPSENYFRTMEAKLHLLDTCGLSHYRMVYESTAVQPNSWMGFQELIYRKVFNDYYADRFGMPKVNVTTSGYVKIFEHVKGARIYGRASSSHVVVETEVKTNQNRVFLYRKVVEVVNGSYEVVVPYAQNTRFPVKPITDYFIRAGNVTKTFSLGDEDVEKGRSIKIDLI